MGKRLFAAALLCENGIRKFHEVFEVVNAAAWNKILSQRKAKPFNQVREQADINFFIKYKTYGLARFSAL